MPLDEATITRHGRPLPPAPWPQPEVAVPKSVVEDVEFDSMLANSGLVQAQGGSLYLGATEDDSTDTQGVTEDGIHSPAEHFPGHHHKGIASAVPQIPHGLPVLSDYRNLSSTIPGKEQPDTEMSEFVTQSKDEADDAGSLPSNATVSKTKNKRGRMEIKKVHKLRRRNSV